MYNLNQSSDNVDSLYFEGKTDQEIANNLNLPLSVVQNITKKYRKAASQEFKNKKLKGNQLLYLDWLKDTGKTLKSTDGIPIKVFELKHTADNKVLSEWAKHFRNHYCLDRQIDTLRDGTGKSRAEYLEDLAFPDKNSRQGPSTRAGDFGEILVSDYVEYILGFWVPRTRFSDRQNRSNPTQGVDVLGLKCSNPSDQNPKDELLIYEVKAKLTSNTTDESKKRLEMAIKDSAKDFNVRKAESLSALKKYFLNRGHNNEMLKIQRYQNPTDHPYIELSGAAAIILISAINDTQIQMVNAGDHPNRDKLQLVIIGGADLMTLVHSLYERASNEA